MGGSRQVHKSEAKWTQPSLQCGKMALAARNEEGGKGLPFAAERDGKEACQKSPSARSTTTMFTSLSRKTRRASFCPILVSVFAGWTGNLPHVANPRKSPGPIKSIPTRGYGCGLFLLAIQGPEVAARHFRCERRRGR